MTNSDSPLHIELYRVLRRSLRRDMTITHGVPNPVAGKILNWFDPANPEYLDRVDAWQKALCDTARLSDYEREFELTLEGRPDRIRLIQQVAKLVYKWHGSPAKETDWNEVEDRLSHPRPITLKDEELEGIKECLSGIMPPNLFELKGRFGPGATAESFTAYEKWTGVGLIPDLPPSFFRGSIRSPWMPKGINHFRCTKMAEVPKSIKSNRVVSSEPSMSMYAQLAINDYLVEQLHRKFRGHISLDDQERHNRLLKLHDMSTLDLSDASDHVSKQLVARVLPQLWPVLAKVRSEYAQLPTGKIIPLELHAPMGAGICFSVMTAVIAGIICYAFRSLHYSPINEPWGVYGDDIIVPTWVVQYVADLLEKAGLVVNHQKSCMGSDYVESCGCELYFGFEVTPVYLKDPPSMIPSSKFELIAQRWADFLPSTLDTLIHLGNPIKGRRWNKNIQELEVLVRVHSARSRIRHLDGYPGLNRWFAIGSRQEANIRPNKIVANQNVVKTESWTKIAWRYRSAINYPTLCQRVKS